MKFNGLISGFPRVHVLHHAAGHDAARNSRPRSTPTFDGPFAGVRLPELSSSRNVVVQQFSELDDMEREIGEKPRPSKAGEQQQAVPIPEIPPLALPFVSEGLERVRDSHC